MNYTDKNYQEFFKEEIYGGFVQFLLNEYGAKTIIDLLRGDPLVTKKGFNFLVTRQLNEFLQLNPVVAKQFVANRRRCISLRNIDGGDLQFPIDPEDDILMVKEGLRPPEVIPMDLSAIPRATKEMKRSAGPMSGQILKGDWKEDRYIHPKRLTLHFKEGYAKKIEKTTLSFMVVSRSEAVYIMYDRFEKRVAYATILGEEDFVFVKPRNGKIKRSRKLRSKI